MADVRYDKAPSLGGWVIGAALGVVGFAALRVVGGFDYMPAAYLGGVVGVLAGAVIGWPQPSGPILHGSASRSLEPVTAAAPVAAAVPSAPPARVSAAGAAKARASAGPVRYDAPRGGKADNLQEIEGIGPTMEKLVNSLGFWHFDQVASWTEADVAWVDDNLKGFKGRVTRDKWVNQARIIVSEGLEAFRVRAKKNDY